MSQKKIRTISPSRPSKLILPSIQRRSNHSESSPLFRRLSQDDLVSPDSDDRVKKWLFVQPEPFKAIEQHPRTHSKSVFDITDSLPEIEDHLPKSSIDKIPDQHYIPSMNVHLKRTTSPKTMSLSSTRSSSTRHGSFVSHSHHVRFRANSFEIPESTTDSSTSKERTNNLFTSLKFDPSLNESDQKKLEKIRQQSPEEFEEYLPTLIRLGLIHLPSTFFEFNGKESKQRQRLMKIFEKEYEERKNQRRLRRLFGVNSTRQDNARSANLLREKLSHQGQYSLLSAYRDEIENELNKKIRFWKTIPMKSTLINSKEPMINSSKEIFSHHEILSSLRTNKLDPQWKKKFMGKMIERGMKILDDVRNLPSINEHQYDHENIVRTFKRWIFLWFSFSNDQ